MTTAREHRNLRNEIRLACSMAGVVLFVNESGMAHHDNRWTRYGVGRGGADLIGLVDGRFIALEVKTGNAKATKEQKMFLDLIRANGGYAVVVRSVEDALNAIRDCRATKWNAQSSA